VTAPADLVVRPRGQFHGYAWFVAVDRAVLVSPYVCEGLRRSAARALPGEAGGVLVGRVLCDADGPYTLVTAVVDAPPDAAVHGRLWIPPELAERLEAEAVRRFPTSEPVGWWHSHAVRGPGRRTAPEGRPGRTDPYHVEIQVFARPAYGEWARVYVGPEDLPAWPVSRTAVELHPGDSARRRRVTGTDLDG
jgi:hypothetical protein